MDHDHGANMCQPFPRLGKGPNAASVVVCGAKGGGSLIVLGSKPPSLPISTHPNR